MRYPLSLDRDAIMQCANCRFWVNASDQEGGRCSVCHSLAAHWKTYEAIRGLALGPRGAEPRVKDAWRAIQVTMVRLTQFARSSDGATKKV